MSKPKKQPVTNGELRDDAVARNDLPISISGTGYGKPSGGVPWHFSFDCGSPLVLIDTKAPYEASQETAEKEADR